MRTLLSLFAVALGLTVVPVNAYENFIGLPPSAGSSPGAPPSAYFNYVTDGAPSAVSPAGHLQANKDVPALSKTPTYGGGDKGCGDGACGLPRRGWGLLWDPWVSFEYVNVWAFGRELPPLVTSSPPGVNGILPAASVLFGNGDVGEDWQGAGRVQFGAWLDQGRCLGLGGKFFIMDGVETTFHQDSDGTVNLSRPFFNSGPFNGQDALIVAGSIYDLGGNLTFRRSGSVDAVANSELLTAEGYARLALHAEANRRFDLIAGYQFARIDDSLTVRAYNMRQILGGFPADTLFSFEDSFVVRNEYNAGELGLLGEFDCGRFTLSALGKLGLGNMHRSVRITGHSTRTLPNQPTDHFNGGLLALGSNLGTFSDDKFVLAPEAEVKLVYHLRPRLDLHVTYTLMCWDAVAFAGNQIDVSRANTPTVNSTQLLGGNLVGANNPVLPQINDTRLWLHGLAAGVTLKF